MRAEVAALKVLDDDNDEVEEGEKVFVFFINVITQYAKYEIMLIRQTLKFGVVLSKISPCNLQNV